MEAVIASKVDRKAIVEETSRLSSREDSTEMRTALPSIDELTAVGHAERRVGNLTGSLAAFEAAAALDFARPALQLEIAADLQALGRLQEAETILEKAALAFSDNIRVKISLGHLRRAKGDYSGALTAFREAAKINPGHPGVQIEIANDLRQLGRLDEAEEVLRALLAGNPDFAGAEISLGHLMRHRGDRCASLNAFERASALEPGNIAIQYEIAVDLKELNRLAEAESTYREILRVEPAHKAALTRLGQLCRRQARWADALAIFESLDQLSPKLPHVRLEMAESLVELGRLDEASHLLSETIVDHPQNTTLLLRQARLCRQRGSFLEALELMEALIGLESTTSALKIEMADIQKRLGRIGDAEATLLHLTADEPANIAARIALGHLQRENGQHEASLATFSAARTLSPDHIGLQVEIANTLRNLDRLAEADAILKQVLAAKPDHSGALIGLGHVKRSLGEHAASLAAFEQGAIVEPDHLNLRLEVARGLRILQRLSEAGAVLQKIVDSHPDHVAAQIELGLVRRQLGDHESALSAFEAAGALVRNHLGLQLEIAFELRNLGRYQEAETILHRVIVCNPMDLAPKIGIAHLKRLQGDRLASLAMFEAAAQGFPAHAGVQLEIANDLWELGRLSDAMDVLDKVLKADPNHLGAMMQRAQILRQQDRRLDALKAFSEVVVAHPQHIQAYVEMAVEERALGRPNHAMERVKTALDKDPLHLSATLLEADLLMSAEETDAALAICQKAMESHPDNIWPWLNAASATFELGQHTQALDLLEAARQQHGNKPEIALREVELRIQLRDWSGAKAALKRQTDVSGASTFWLRAHGIYLAILTGELDEAEQRIATASPTARLEHARLALLHGQLAEARLNYSGAVSAYRESLDLNPTDPWPHFELARASLLALDLDTSRSALASLNRLTRSAILLKGQSVNISQNHIGQLLDEFQLDLAGLDRLRQIRERPPAEQLAPLVDLITDIPDYTPAAITAVVALRLEGRLITRNAVKAEENSQIPRRIIQFWDADPSDEIVRLMASWREVNRDFKWECFNDHTAQEFLRHHYPHEVLDAYQRARHAAQRADVFRLALLAAQGGIYADADDRCVNPIQVMLSPLAHFVAHQEDYGSIGNNFLAVVPGHPVILRALDLGIAAINRGDSDLIWLSTGPGLLTRAFATEWAKDPGAKWLKATQIVPLGEMNRIVGIHYPVTYKKTERHWSRQSFARQRPKVA